MTAAEDHSFSPESYSSPDGTTNLFDDDSNLGGNLGEDEVKVGKKVSNGRKGPGGADKRANHNAIERARRESLNGRFMTLADALPSMASVKRPSKSIIVTKALDFVFDAQVKEHALIKENNELRREVDQLRARLGMSPLPPPTPLPAATTPTNASLPSPTLTRVVEVTPELSLPIPMILPNSFNSHGFNGSFDNYQDETTSGISPSSQSFGSSSPIDDSTSPVSAPPFFQHHHQLHHQQVNAQQQQQVQLQHQLQQQQNHQLQQHQQSIQQSQLRQTNQQQQQQAHDFSNYGMNTSYLLANHLQHQQSLYANSAQLVSGNLMMSAGVAASNASTGAVGDIPWLSGLETSPYSFMA